MIKIIIWCVCGALIVSVGFLLISEVILLSRLGVDAWWEIEKGEEEENVDTSSANRVRR